MATRYEIFVCHPEDKGKLVNDTQRPELGGIGPVFSEAEASIITFALNAVAEGRTLTKLMPPESTDGPRYAGFYCQDYAGPTEGVAP